MHSGALADVLARIEKRMPEVDVVLERVESWRQTVRLLANEIEFADSEAEGYAVVSRLLGLTPRNIIVRSDPLDVLERVQARLGVCVLATALAMPAFPQVVYKSLADNLALQVVLIAINRLTESNSLLSNLSEML